MEEDKEIDVEKFDLDNEPDDELRYSPRNKRWFGSLFKVRTKVLLFPFTEVCVPNNVILFRCSFGAIYDKKGPEANTDV